MAQISRSDSSFLAADSLQVRAVCCSAMGQARSLQ